MKSREFVYTVESVLKIDKDEHREFLVDFQKAVLLSLAERKLLTREQAERALDKITVSSSRR